VHLFIYEMTELGMELVENARFGDLEEVIRCLHDGADVNSPDENGSTALFMASGNGHLEIARELLTHPEYT